MTKAKVTITNYLGGQYFFTVNEVKFTKGKKLHRFLTDNIAKFNDVEKAAAFFIFNRITFSGTS